MKELPPASEIDKHVRENYLANLPVRLILIRQLVAERRWTKLRLECEKLCRGAKNHGIDELADLAEEIFQALPADDHAVQSLDEESRVMLQRLFQWYDALPGAQKSIFPT